MALHFPASPHAFRRSTNNLRRFHPRFPTATVEDGLRSKVLRGVRIQTLARQYHVSVAEGLTAIRFAESPPALILRALVEGWTWNEIKVRLNESTTRA